MVLPPLPHQKTADTSVLLTVHICGRQYSNRISIIFTLILQTINSDYEVRKNATPAAAGTYPGTRALECLDGLAMKSLTVHLSGTAVVLLL